MVLTLMIFQQHDDERQRSSLPLWHEICAAPFGMIFAQVGDAISSSANLSQGDARMPTTKTDTKELTSAIETLHELINTDALDRLQPIGPGAVYTTMVTIWMMTMQRLGGDKTLNAVVKDVLAHSRDLLPDNRRLREGTLSKTSGAYSEARSRLQLETVEFFANSVSDSLIHASPSWFDDRRAFILDGTTITLPPTPELQEAFPPASNQHGQTVWPVAMLLVAHELQSGCALPPEIGAMYGENNTSEARLSEAMVRRLPAGSIVLADSGYGIFSVAHATVEAGHQVLFRLTKSRFKPLRRQAVLVEEADGYKTWQLRWTPSAKDRKSHPELPKEAAVEVWLHEVPLDNGETLYLVTTLAVDAEQAGEFYQRRYDVEHDIRDVKVTLKTERIRAKSVSMVKKELLTSFVAYNLVIQFRRQAASLAGVAPRRLSFKGVWDTFQSFLLTQPSCSVVKWQSRYDEALQIASRDKLPNRPGRSYPRRAHPRRPKSTKFMKKINAEKAKKKKEIPPEQTPK
jgi:hypothetical protein